MKIINPQTQESQQTPNIRNIKLPQKHIIIKVLKTSSKAIILKLARENRHFQHKEKRKIVDFMLEKNKWEDSGAVSLQSWKNKTVNLKFCTQQKYVSKNEVKNVLFPDIQKPKEFISSSSALE